MKLAQIGEIEVIRRLTQHLKGNGEVIRGVGDDAAVLAYSAREYLLFSTDMLIGGVHFPSLADLRAKREQRSAFYNVGWKALACSISDIIAMGGIPQHCLISLGLRADMDYSLLKQLYTGIEEIASHYRINIVGGDVVESEEMVVNIALLGRVKKENLVLRSGAKVGDRILLSGELRRKEKHRELPPLDKVQTLIKRFNIHSMIDISDGLILDLSRIIKESKKGAKIYLEKIPISPSRNRRKDLLREALYGGEEFELLFTTDKDSAERIVQESLGYIIGEINGKKGVIESSQGKRIEIDGYQHFKDNHPFT
ncbi:MAG: hypothetical protein DRP75_00075 [Candidatus Omnitrophota bacterium]|nr:MAG: hypothetical protein DRP75_00075 [Candidatus Omnitrophota bacterium]